MTEETYENSEAILALILGLLALVVPVLAPFAWFYGHREVDAIDRGDRDPAHRSQANFGRIVGMVISLISALFLTFAIFAVVYGVFVLAGR
jgi:ABC-type Fe3+ transport system permease subunit